MDVLSALWFNDWDEQTFIVFFVCGWSKFELKEKTVISCFGANSAYLTFNPICNLSWGNSTKSRWLPVQDSAEEPENGDSSSQEKSTAKSRWTDGVSLIILSETMQKKQLCSLKGMLLKKKPGVHFSFSWVQEGLP